MTIKSTCGLRVAPSLRTILSQLNQYRAYAFASKNFNHGTCNGQMISAASLRTKTCFELNKNQARLDLLHLIVSCTFIVPFRTKDEPCPMHLDVPELE